MSEETSIIKIDPRYKLELVASRNNCRPEIENIKLDESKRFGKVAVATNGRAIAIVPITHEGGEKLDGLVTPEALKASRKNKPLAGTIMLNGKLEIPNGPSFPRPLEADGIAYPKWEQVLPEPGAKIAFTVALNAKMLWELAQAIGSDGGVTLRFIDEMSPITVRPYARYGGDNKGGEHGALMPMRIGGD